MRGINDYMNVLDSNQVDNLVYDNETETLQLTSKGVGVGDKVSVKEMLDDGTPVVDLDSNSDNSGADDGEDNVVQF